MRLPGIQFYRAERQSLEPRNLSGRSAGRSCHENHLHRHNVFPAWHVHRGEHAMSYALSMTKLIVKQTLFSMNSLDWTQTGTSVVRPGFKYFWIVTLPLTAVVILTWVLSMSRLRRRTRITALQQNDVEAGPDNELSALYRNPWRLSRKNTDCTDTTLVGQGSRNK